MAVRAQHNGCGTDRTHAPRIVIDGRGREVGVLVDYRHYLTLLGMIAAEMDRDSLPTYWRSALDGCLAVAD